MKKNNWILEIIKGSLILVFGLFCLINPASASITMTWIFTFMILVFAIIALTDAFMLKGTFNKWWLLLIECVIDAVFVIILLFNFNQEGAKLLVYLVGAFAVVTGAFRFVRILARKDMWLNNLLFGLGAITAGVLFFIFNDAVIDIITTLLGAAATVFGLVVIIFGIRMKKGKEQ